MDQVNVESRTQIYPPRFRVFGLAMLFTALTLGIIVSYVLSVTMTGHLPEEGLFSIIVTATVLLFFGIGSVTWIYWLLTPTPLLTLDSLGLSYHLPTPWNHRLPWIQDGFVQWADMQSIVVARHTIGQVKHIALSLMLRPDARPLLGQRRIVRLTISQPLLPMRPEQLADTIRHFFHDVTYVDDHGAKSGSSGDM